MAARFSIIPAVWFDPDSPLNSTERLVLAVLGMWANNRTGECFPSAATIAAHAALNERSIRRAVQGLKKHGVIRIKRRTNGNGAEISSLYKIVGFDTPLTQCPPPLTESPAPPDKNSPNPLTQCPTNVVINDEEEVGRDFENAPSPAPEGAVGRSVPSKRLRASDSSQTPEPQAVEPSTAEQKQSWRALLVEIGAGPKA